MCRMTKDFARFAVGAQPVRDLDLGRRPIGSEPGRRGASQRSRARASLGPAAHSIEQTLE